MEDALKNAEGLVFDSKAVDLLVLDRNYYTINKHNIEEIIIKAIQDEIQTKSNLSLSKFLNLVKNYIKEKNIKISDKILRKKSAKIYKFINKINLIKNKFEKNFTDIVLLTDLNGNVIYSKNFDNLDLSSQEKLDLINDIVNRNKKFIKIKTKKGRVNLKVYVYKIGFKKNYIDYFIFLKIIKKDDLFLYFQKKYKNFNGFAFILDDKLNVLYMNNYFSDLYGSDFIDRLYSNGIKDTNEDIKNIFLNCNEKDDKQVFSIIVNKKIFFVKKACFKIKTKNKNKFYFFALKDVTVEEKIKRNVLKLEKKYMNIFNNIPSMVVITDIFGNIKEANLSFINFFKLENKNIKGKKINIILDNKNIDDLLKNPGKDFYINLKLNNEDVILLAKSAEERDFNENTIGRIITLSNISQAYQSQKEIKDTENYLNLIINSLNIGVMLVDNDMNIVFVNDSLRRMMKLYEGKESSYINGINNISVDILSYKIYIEHIRDTLNSFANKEIEYKLKTYKGDVIHTRQVLIPICSKYINGIGCLILIEDITKIKEAEKQIKEKEENLKYNQKMEIISNLILGIAHDLNNPLGSIYGFAHLLLKEENLDKEIQTDIKMIAEAATQTKDIVENLLKFVRKGNKEYTTFKIIDTIKKTLMLIDYYIKKANIKVVLHSSRDYEIFGYIQDIQQVFYNIILNAIDALKEINESERLIKIEVFSIDNYIRIKIFNNGPEIPSDLREKIFELFYTTKSFGHGTGLGLSLSKEIIINHNGRIFVDPNTTSGSCFIIDLPKTNVLIKAIEKKEDTFILNGKNILLVDDDEKFIRLILKMLDDKKNNIKYTNDYKEAETLISNNEFDLIISDIFIQNGNGLDLYKKFNDRTNKFIFVTGAVLDEKLFNFFGYSPLNSIS